MSIVSLVTPREFKKLRTSIGFSQSMLAKEIDVTIRTLTRWENGETPIPKIAEMALKFVAQGQRKGKR